VTLNDVQFVEAARSFAKRILRDGGATGKDRIAYGFRLATSREIRETEMAVFYGVYSHSRERYRSDEEAAIKLISTGESKRDESLDSIDHAAMTIVASMILNIDETLTRE